MTMFEPSKRTAIVELLTERLVKRRMSAFNGAGDALCRTHVTAAIDAIEQDIEADQSEAMRTAAVAFVAEFVPRSMGYSDLRFFARLLREQASEYAPEAQARAIEQWCYEFLAVCSTHFIVQRDRAAQRQAEERDIERYEAQLAQLKVALDEKTQLLELIRQASTPIAPVVGGIIVVPLVGTFDRFRAEILTERLLDEISRSRTRVAILDISGVPVFDTDAAQLILSLARSVRLLGARVVLVGMSPDNARTIVELGVRLEDIETCATLQDGLRSALASQKLAIVQVD